MASTTATPSNVSVTTDSLMRRRVDLPVEIWLKVFRYATFVAESESIVPVDPFIPEKPFNVMDCNSHMQVMKTKRALVLVSRVWHSIATEFLYERINIRGSRRTGKIITALSPPPGKTVSENARWTRHIDVHIHTLGSVSHKYLREVYHILHLCPNICTLNFNSTKPLPKLFVDAIARLRMKTVLHLAWPELTGTLDDELMRLSSFLPSFESLRFLDLSQCQGEMQASIPDTARKTELPNVEHLVVTTYGNGLSIATSFRLPRLCTLLFKSHNPIPYPDQVTDFVDAHGANLTSLELVSLTGYYPGPRDIFLRPHACPRLRDLVFDTHHEIIEMLPAPHPEIRRIGLRGLSTDDLDTRKRNSWLDCASCSSRAALQLKSLNRINYPALEVVRTLGYLVDQAEGDNTYQLFREWTNYFEHDGVDLQDGAGIVWLLYDPEEEYDAYEEDDTPKDKDDAPKGDALDR